MNLLTENVPDYITVGDYEFKLKTDFKLWVRYVIASENGDVTELNKALYDIFGNAKIPKKLMEDFIGSIFTWLFPPSKEKQNVTKKNKSRTYDFEADGNIIYSELWQYFPELMSRGLTWHEGMELISLLISNKDTELHHRAFARVGDFSKMSKEEKKYWTQERARLQLPDKRTVEQKQDEFDSAMSALF